MRVASGLLERTFRAKALIQDSVAILDDLSLLKQAENSSQRMVNEVCS